MVNERILQVNFRVKKYHFFAPLTFSLSLDFFLYLSTYCNTVNTFIWNAILEDNFDKSSYYYYDNLPGFLITDDKQLKILKKFQNSSKMVQLYTFW